jgi:hypothetical protein
VGRTGDENRIINERQNDVNCCKGSEVIVKIGNISASGRCVHRDIRRLKGMYNIFLDHVL